MYLRQQVQCDVHMRSGPQRHGFVILSKEIDACNLAAKFKGGGWSRVVVKYTIVEWNFFVSRFQDA